MLKLLLKTSACFSLKSSLKNLLYLIFWLFAEILLLVSTVGVSLAAGSIYGGLNSLELASYISKWPAASYASMAVLLLSTGMTALFAREKPLALPRMAFLLPVTAKQRKDSLLKLFLLRLMWLFMAIVLFHHITLGGFFYEKSLPGVLTQTGLYLLTVWSLLLKTGFRGVNGKSLEESTSPLEKFVNFYWILFLLAQQLALGIGHGQQLYSRFPLLYAPWIILLVLQGCAAAAATKECLEKASDFEQIYCQKQRG